MPETQQAKEINAPTILHTIGIGVTVGIIGCAIFFSIVDHSPISIEYILAFFSYGWPYFFFFVFACTFGAYIGRSRKKTFSSLWKGTIVGLFVSVFVVFCWLLSRLSG